MKWKPFWSSRNALAAVCTDILHFCGSKFTQAYNKVHVYSTVVPYSRWVTLYVQNLAVAGHVWEVVAQHRDFLYKIIRARNFGHKYKMVFEYRKS